MFVIIFFPCFEYFFASYWRYWCTMTKKEDLILRPGDLISIVATARKVSPQEIENAVRLYESWGLRVRVPDGLFAVENQFAGDDVHRAEMLQSQLDDPEVRAIFCARGGYGTVRILDRLDFSRFASHPKWIVGYSDVTALHSHISRLCDIPTLHGIMPINITEECLSAEKADALESLHGYLFTGKGKVEYRISKSQADCYIREGKCNAPVVGGNLSVLYSLLGSKSDIDTEGKILLLEDLDEYLYHIDRMVIALKRAGKFDKLSGLIIGQFTKMHDNTVPFGKTARQIIYDAVAEYGFPVADCFPVGHVELKNVAIPLNMVGVFKVSDNEVSICFD